MTAITLCGCGWLGKHMARRRPSTMSVLGTTRTQASAEALRGADIQPLRFTLGDNPADLAHQSASNPVILNIPPGARKRPLDSDFVSNMLALIDAFIAAGCTQLIFISTTAVYGDKEGLVNEKTRVAPVTESGHAHVKIEQHLLNQYPAIATVVRLSGLIDSQRHPVHFLAGRHLDKGEQVVNLVHEQDVCAGLFALLAKPQPGRIFHLTALEHPKRGDYYPWCAQKKGLEAPVFNSDFARRSAGGKHIDAQRSWHALGVTPVYPSPYDML